MKITGWDCRREALGWEACAYFREDPYARFSEAAYTAHGRGWTLLGAMLRAYLNARRKAKLAREIPVQPAPRGEGGTT